MGYPLVMFPYFYIPAVILFLASAWRFHFRYYFRPPGNDNPLFKV